MSKPFRTVKSHYQMCSLEKARQKAYLAADDSVPEIPCIEQFICTLSELLNDSNPTTASRFKRWLHFHKISQLTHTTNEVTL